MACGMTVAPSMEVAINTVAEPLKRGIRPAATAFGSGGAMNSPAMKPNVITSSNAMMSFSNMRCVAPFWKISRIVETTPIMHPPGKQRQAEQQIEGDGTADHFGQIGGDGDDLGLHEEHEPTAVAHALAKDFRQALACDDAQLGGLVLDQYAHAVGDYEHPDQQIAISCAGSDVGGHVTRIHIGYGRHESRPENARQCVSVTFLAHGLSVPFPVTGD